MYTLEFELNPPLKHENVPGKSVETFIICTIYSKCNSIKRVGYTETCVPYIYVCLTALKVVKC